MKAIYQFIVLFIILFTSIHGHSQSTPAINIVRFNNSANYTAGSGVSVIINPTGVFNLDNQYILELSNTGGTFPASPTVLNTLNEFYVPVINGTLPAGLTPGSYKLRVRSTNPSVTIETTNFQIVTSASSTDIPTAKSPLLNNSTFFNCIEDPNSNQLIFGTLTQSSDASVVGSIGSPNDRKITIQGYDPLYTYTVKMTSKIDVPSLSTTTTDISHTNGVFYIPTSLGIGTYIFEIEKTENSNAISSVNSLVFLFHGNATNLGNTSTGNVCVGKDVNFTVTKDINGIGRNYYGSKYEIDYGDGIKIFLTHAELISISPLKHIYDKVSCGQGNGKFIVKETLFNKGIKNSCNNFIDNGEPITTNVNTSLPPVADFDLINKQCINIDIDAINTTKLGEWGSTGGNCSDAATFTWYYKRPTDPDFLEVTNNSWIISTNTKLPSLNIPASFITVAGCWQIKLESRNNDLCQTVSEVSKTIKIEAVPTPTFTPLSTIDLCPEQKQLFTNSSNILNFSCQEPSYSWTVTPVSAPATSGGYTFVNPTSSTTQDADIKFTQEGSYDLNLSITNSCGTFTSLTPTRVDVSGQPSVSIIPAYSICKETLAQADLDFNTSPIKPTYSVAPYLPTSFSWTISGTGVTASDYEFIGGTNSTSKYPKIRFNSFKTYNINIAVEGSCGINNASCIFTLKETPIITNTDKTQTICSGSSTVAIPLTSNMASDTNFTWTVAATNGVTGFGSTSGSGSTIPAVTLVNPTNTTETVTYRVTPHNNGCDGTPMDFVVTVNPKPAIATKTVTICSGIVFNETPANGSGNIVPTGTTYTWSNPTSNPSGAITGGSAQANQSNISQTLTNTTNAPATLTYTVTPTSGSAGNCVGTPFTVTVTVNPNGQINSIDDVIACKGEPVAQISLTSPNTGGANSYTWNNNNTTTGLVVSGNQTFIPSFTATNSGVSPISDIVTVTPTFTNNSVSCIGTTKSYKITVNPEANVIKPADIVICNENNVNPIAFASTNTGGTTTFSWTNNTTSIGLAVSGSGNIPSFTAVNNGTAPIVATITITPTFTNDGKSCTGPAKTYTITVNPTAVVNAITDIVVCDKESTTVTFETTNTDGTITYNWTNNNSAIGLSALSGNGNISFTATNTSTAPIESTITIIPSFSNGGVNCSGNAKTFKITVNPSPKVTKPTNISACSGTTIPKIDFSTTNTAGTTTYIWSNNNTAIGLGTSGNESIPQFIATNSGTTTLISTITVTPTYSDGVKSCTGNPQTFTITIYPVAGVSKPADQTVCKGENTTAINFTGAVAGTTYSWTNDNTNIGLSTSGTGNILPFAGANTGSLPITANITVTPRANGCDGIPQTFKITINPTPTVNSVPNQVVCNNSVTTAIAFSGTATTYIWSIDKSIGLTPISGTGNIPTFTATNISAIPVTATITVTPVYSNAGKNCSGTSTSFTITVNPTPTVNTISTQTYCHNASTSIITISGLVTGTTYNWTNNNPSIGLASSGNGNIPSFTVTNAGTTPVSATITVTPTANSCLGIPKTFSITVNPLPTATMVGGATVCLNDAQPTITFTGANGTAPYSFTYKINSGINQTVTTSSGNSITIPSLTDTVGTFTYTLLSVKDGSSTACSQNQSGTVVITINPRPAVTFSTGNQTILSGTTSSAVDLSSTVSGSTFVWTADQLSGITGVITSGTNYIPVQTLTNSTNAPITITYKAIATFSNGGINCPGAESIYTITVNPLAKINGITEIVCSNKDFSITPINGGTNVIPVGTTYSWGIPSVTGSMTGGTIASNQSSINGTLFNPTTTPQTATYIVTPRANGFDGSTFNVVVTVYPSITIADIVPTAICSETAFSVDPTTIGGNLIPAGTTYTWSVTSNNNVTGQFDSSTSDISVISQTLTNKTNIAQMVVYTVTPKSGDVVNCVDKTFKVTVTVNPKPSIPNQSTIICSGTAFTVPLSNGVGTILPAGTLFTWTVTNPTGITGASNQTTPVNSIGQQLTNTTTAPIYVIYRVTPISGNCTGNPFDVTVTVNPPSQVNDISNQIVCDNSNTAAINFSTANTGGTTTYSWKNNVANIGLAATGTGDIAIFNAKNTADNIVTATISVTPTFNNGGAACIGNPKSFTITVYPSPKVLFSPSNQTICSDGSTSAITLSSPTTGVTFRWSVIQPTGITGIANLSGTTNTIPSETITNTTSNPITITYKAIATTIGDVICDGPEYTYIITVNPKPSITTAQTATICSNTEFRLSPTDGSGNIVPTGTLYTWVAPSINPTLAITGGSAVSTFQSPIRQTLTNVTEQVATATYIVTPKAGSCSGNSFPVIITVNPSPKVEFDKSPQTICSNANTEIVNLTSPTNGATFSWTANVPAGITGATISGENTIPVQTLINTTNTPLEVIYTATASVNTNGISCTGQTFTYQITVNPKPTIPNQTSTICSGTAFTIPLSNYPPNTILPAGTLFTWTVVSPTGITGASDQTTAVNSIGQTLTNITNASIDVVYTVTPISVNCTGTPFTIRVTVKPTPKISNFTELICSRTSFTRTPVNGNNDGLTDIVPAGTIYSWAVPVSNPIGAIVGTAGNNVPTTISQTLINTFNEPATLTYTVTPSSGGCVGANLNILVTVNPIPKVTFSPSPQTICSEDSSQEVTLNSTTSGVSFRWTTTQPAGILETIPTSGTDKISAQKFTNTTNSPITITYTAIATTAGTKNCDGDSFTYSITVKPRPKVADITKKSCSESAFMVIPAGTSNIIPSGTTYTWSTPAVTGGITGGTSGNIQPNINGTLFNPTNSNQTATYTVTPISNGCIGSTFKVIITVNPTPVIPDQNTTICSEDTFVVKPINGNPTSAMIVPLNTTYTWTVTNNTNVTGWANSSAPGIWEISQTLKNLTNITQNVVYTVTPTSGDDGNCVGNPFTLTVVVNPKPTITNQTTTTCSGTAFTVPLSNGSGTILPAGTLFTWTVVTSIGITGAYNQTAAVSSIGQTLTNITNIAIDVVYTVTPISGNCTGTPFTVTVTVKPTPKISNFTELICSKTDFNRTPINGNNDGLTDIVPVGTTYTWTIPISNPIGAIVGSIGNNILNTISQALTNTHNEPATLSYTISPSSGGCIGANFNILVTVNPIPKVAFSPSPQTICSEDTSQEVTLNSTTSGVSFRWTTTQPAGILETIPTSGTDKILPQKFTNTTNAPITITYVAIATTGGTKNCDGDPFTYTITIKPRPKIADFADKTCSEYPFSIMPAGATDIIPVGTTYSWSAPVVTGGITGGVTNAGQSTVFGTLFNPTNVNQTATYMMTPIANSCEGATFKITITVNPTPVISNEMPATICSEENLSVTPTDVGTGNIIPSGTTYTWTIIPNTNVSGQSDSSISGVSTISQTLKNLSDRLQTLIYTVTPTSGYEGNCVGKPFTITVRIDPRPSVSDKASIICSKDPYFFVPATGNGDIVPVGTTYIWAAPVSNPANAIVGGTADMTGTAKMISQNLTNITPFEAIITYKVTPTSGNCIGKEFTITVTVQPEPIVAVVNNNQTICSGAKSEEVLFTTTTPGAFINWTCTPPTGISGALTSGIGNIPVQSLINSTDKPIAVTYTAVATTGGRLACDGLSLSYIIVVNPSPKIRFSQSPQTICSDDTTNLVTLSSTTPDATFSWTITPPSGISGINSTSGTFTIPTETLVNTTNTPIDVVYNTIATTSGSAVCSGNIAPYIVTVNPRPNIDNQALTICNNQDFTVNPVNEIPTTTTIVPHNTLYTWTISSNPNITGASAGSGSSISQTLSNSSVTAQKIIYTVVPSYLNCVGKNFTIEVTVYPSAKVIFSDSDQTICNETNSTLINLSSTTPGNISFEWKANVPTEISGALLSGTTTIPVQQLVNNTINALTVTYTAVATFNYNGIGCPGPESVYKIIVNPTIITSEIVSNYNGYQISVYGNTDGFIDLNVSGGSGNYTYYWTGSNGFTAITQDIKNLPAGTYTVTINDGYCTPTVLTYILKQPPGLIIKEDLDAHTNSLCFGDNKGTLGVTITQVSVAPFDYQILNSAGIVVNSVNNTDVLSHTFNGLYFGTYTIKVIDANGSIKTISGLIVKQPTDIVIEHTSTPVSCYGGNDGTIKINITGGTTPYKALWDNLKTGFFIDNLLAGDYSVTVTDANNCTKTIVVKVAEQAVFVIKPIINQITCIGANNGSIILNIEGGEQPLKVVWADTDTAGSRREKLKAGTYTVTISDAKPCFINKTFVIIEPQEIVLDAVTTHSLDCDNANSGSINLNVSGGTPPFSYLWSNSIEDEDLNSIPAGNYGVEVKDSKGCLKNEEFVITRPTPIVLDFTSETDFDCETKRVDKILTAKSSGGVPPLNFHWSSGNVSGQNNEIMTTDKNGFVLIEAKDSRGCQVMKTYNIELPELGNPSFDTTSIGFKTFGWYSIIDPIKFTNTSTGDFKNISWDFGDNTFSTEINPVHSYAEEGIYVVKLTVTYDLGCVKTFELTLKVEKGYVLVIPNAFSPNSDGLNDKFRPITKGLINIQMNIYDTWGSMIYSETANLIEGWNGQIKGRNAENGNYYYKVKAETFYGTVISVEHPFVLIK